MGNLFWICYVYVKSFEKIFINNMSLLLVMNVSVYFIVIILRFVFFFRVGILKLNLLRLLF